MGVRWMAVVSGCMMLGMVAGISRAQAPLIVPRPVKMQVQQGDEFQIQPDTKIVVDQQSRATGEYLADLLVPALGTRLQVVSGPEQSGNRNINLRVDATSKLGAEGYTFESDAGGITIAGGAEAGVFYGVQTLRQLLPPQLESKNKVEGVSWSVPSVKIDDKPRFGWRGYMLDVSRHFRDVDYVKHILDLMALEKLNTFHWHLTDDPGWRIEIKKYPRLTEIGAWGKDKAGKKVGGFYTQDEIRDVVKYAAVRHITIVPEIEMPGHSNAALVAYPEYACTDEAAAVTDRRGIQHRIYNPANPQTYVFLDNILDEVMALFPGKFIHIGGDEVPKGQWKKSAQCQAFMKEHNLKTEDELQSYFVKKMTAYIQGKGRRVIGWDEILEGGLAPGAAVMSWRGTKGGIAAAEAGHDVVMSPKTYCYLDYNQSKNQHPPRVGPLLSLEKVYSFNPTDGLTAADAKYVLGAQGNLWTERVASDARADYKTFPRLCALSEVVWSPPDLKDFDDFKQRLAGLEKRFDVIGVNYFREPVKPSHAAPAQ